MKSFLLLTTLLLLALVALLIHRLGGWKYTWYRFSHPGAGLYNDRKQHFALLPVRPGAVIFLGDSQIEQAEWHELLADTVPVLNRGITGDHVDGVFERLEEVLRHKPLRIQLLVGINDLIAGKPMEAIVARYREMVQKIRHDSPDTQLVLWSVLPVNNTVKRVGIDNQTVRALNVSIAQIARDYALTYLDIHDSLKDTSGNLSPKYTEDGIHLNGEGYRILGEKVKREQ